MASTYLAIATQATNIYSGTFSVQEGDSYDNTLVYNSATVDMTGGSLLSLDMLNSSIADISGGSIAEGLYAWNSSTVNMTGGTVGWNLDASDSSTVNLYGGAINDWVYAEDLSVINVYGYDFAYDPLAGSWNGGQLTGRWAYGGTFAIDFVDNIDLGSTYDDHVVLHEFIPEPTTLLLLGMGGLLLRKRQLLIKA